MKILKALQGFILGAAALFAAVPGTAFADARPGPASMSALAEARPLPTVQPGTDAEARMYAQREADSPETQDFEGGGVVGLVVLVLVVLLIVYLVQR